MNRIDNHLNRKDFITDNELNKGFAIVFNIDHIFDNMKESREVIF